MNAHRSMMTVGEIAAQLNDRAEEVFYDIFPGAVRDGPELCVGDLHGAAGKSLRLHIGPGKRGVWKDFAGGEAGDVLKLIQLTVAGGDMGRAVAWAKLFLGIDEGDRAAIEKHRIEAAAAREKSTKAAADQRERVRKSAVARWHEARAIVRGDPVWRYLAARAIDLDRLGRVPGAIRFHPDLQYGASTPGGPAPYRGPAMVAMVNALDGAHIATHRTWLTERGGVWSKAGAAELGLDSRGQPNDPKKVLGSPMGGHIHLWKGGVDRPFRDVPEGTDIYVSEGIEDGLTAAVADPSLRVVSMLALGLLANMALPEQMGRLILLKQNDPPGSDAERALMRAVKTHRAAGRTVLFVQVARAGCKDLNDLARLGA